MKSLFYDIAPYHILVFGKPIKVLPMEDGVYRVYRKGKMIADLYPEITATGIYWNAFGQLSAAVADEIGTAIYAFEV
jgi:hypothetical protein